MSICRLQLFVNPSYPPNNDIIDASNPLQTSSFLFVSIGLLCAIFAPCGFAQDKFELKPILYSESTPTDEVQQLADLLASKPDALEWTEEHGYLESVLKTLKIPVSSQSTRLFQNQSPGQQDHAADAARGLLQRQHLRRLGAKTVT